MLKVGITGGIGSGKTIVCRVFKTLGIPVFSADAAARYLMEHDPELVSRVKSILGAEVYVTGKLDPAKVSAIVFKDPAKLTELNAIVHPATTKYACEWHEQQHAPYTIKEAALFFEAGTNKEMDVMIGVSAPLELRIIRAMERGNLNREEIISRINSQMDESEKMKRCNYVIINDDVTAVLPQVLKLHEALHAKN